MSQAKSGNKGGQVQTMESKINYPFCKVHEEGSQRLSPLIFNSLGRYVRQILYPHFIEK